MISAGLLSKDSATRPGADNQKKGSNMSKTNRGVYPLEDVRSFVVKRNWLVGDDDEHLVTLDEYERLKARKALRLSVHRLLYIRAFIDGYNAGR